MCLEPNRGHQGSFSVLLSLRPHLTSQASSCRASVPSGLSGPATWFLVHLIDSELRETTEGFWFWRKKNLISVDYGGNDSASNLLSDVRQSV